MLAYTKIISRVAIKVSGGGVGKEWRILRKRLVSLMQVGRDHKMG